MLTTDFFQRTPEVCARELIGKTLRWGDCSGIIVETEAYAEVGDEACHTFFRPSARAFVEAHDAGAAYVYLNYGMYWLTNVLIKDGGSNGFVLIRALEPCEGVEVMKERRAKEKLADLCSGPGKLSMALAIDGRDHGRSLVETPKACFEDGPELEVQEDLRIGISKSEDLPWRFLARDSSFLSVKPRLPG